MVNLVWGGALLTGGGIWPDSAGQTNSPRARPGDVIGGSISVTILLIALALGQAQTKVEVDRYGDPLPKGAVARLGALRLHHPGHLESRGCSPDGKPLATSGADGSVCLWDWARRKELPRLPATNVGTLAFSPDGSLLATASDREKIRLWD